MEIANFAEPLGHVVGVHIGVVKVAGCDMPVVVGHWMPSRDNHVIYYA